MLNIRTVILSFALVVILVVAVPLVTARTEVASNPASDPASAPDKSVEIADQRKEPIPSYRSPLDVCYDVPLSAVEACRLAEQADAP